jgi:hypothetical protein
MLPDVTHRRSRPVSSWMRGLIASTLVLIVAMTAVVPHRHGLTDGLLPASTNGASLSAVKAAENAAQVPCTACAREQHAGVAPAAWHTVAPRTQALAASPVAVSAETAGHDANVRLRGPPSSMSVC